MTENQIDTKFLWAATKEDVQNILHDIKKAYENRIKLLEEELKKVDAIIEIKDHDNDTLANYMFSVFETHKNNLLKETDLKSLINFF